MNIVFETSGSSPAQTSPFQPSQHFGFSTSFGLSSQSAFGTTVSVTITSTQAFRATSTRDFGRTSTPSFGLTAIPSFGTSASACGSSTTPSFSFSIYSCCRSIKLHLLAFHPLLPLPNKLLQLLAATLVLYHHTVPHLPFFSTPFQACQPIQTSPSVSSSFDQTQPGNIAGLEHSLGGLHFQPVVVRLNHHGEMEFLSAMHALPVRRRFVRCKKRRKYNHKNDDDR
ncbi:hypothetical protein M0R45_023693 [Rubus argutus]|uniref:Uncharacterized protein n=1 Tax=Rubus argutus TaxID=59490 RepID=A0AAW1WQG8_RUBAR